MGRKKSLDAPPRLTATKIVWKDWLCKNPDRMHEVPLAKRPDQKFMDRFFRDNPQYFDASFLLKESLADCAAYIFKNRPEHRERVYQYVTDDVYYYALMNDSLSVKDLFEGPIAINRRLSLWSNQRCELLIVFGEEARELIGDEKFTSTINDSGQTTLRNLLVARPDFVVYVNPGVLSSVTLSQVRRIRPEIDSYLAALI